jgi:DNA-binding GntR family transcriptional regulator
MNASGGGALTLGDPVPADASLAERAYHALRDRIVTLEMPPGSLIREEELMKQLGMSRTPLREALSRLGREKLVTVMSRRGTFVSEVNVGDVGQIYEFRRELEVLTAGWAAERRTERDLPLIDAQLDALRGAPPSPDADAREQIAVDRATHSLIYRLSRNAHLEEVLGSYYFLAIRIWFLAAGRVSMSEPYNILAEVLEAIKRQDPDAARKHSRLHSETAESAIRAAL